VVAAVVMNLMLRLLVINSRDGDMKKVVAFLCLFML
jgi:hypothetical protein